MIQQVYPVLHFCLLVDKLPPPYLPTVEKYFCFSSVWDILNQKEYMHATLNLLFLLSFSQAMTVLVRDVDYHTISTSQLQVLLVYCEQDMHDFTRQATAFTLLKVG